MSVLSRETFHEIKLQLNGKPRTGHAHPRLLLSDFLRHELGATGTHVGCEHGVCGACTVRIDGVAQRACMMLAVQADGREVQTVEGLAEDCVLGDLQAAFKRHHALQCGFCTAGILMSCADWLGRVSDPSEAQVREMLSGHLCRCTGYTPIVAAVLEVARLRREAAHA
jgi:2-furoyl-CoA dehydrogenase 2Fe-2S iron sulfur subunit